MESTVPALLSTQSVDVCSATNEDNSQLKKNAQPHVLPPHSTIHSIPFEGCRNTANSQGEGVSVEDSNSESSRKKRKPDCGVKDVEEQHRGGPISQCEDGDMPSPCISSGAVSINRQYEVSQPNIKKRRISRGSKAKAGVISNPEGSPPCTSENLHRVGPRMCSSCGVATDDNCCENCQNNLAKQCNSPRCHLEKECRQFDKASSRSQCCVAISGVDDTLCLKYQAADDEHFQKDSHTADLLNDKKEVALTLSPQPTTVQDPSQRDTLDCPSRAHAKPTSVKSLSHSVGLLPVSASDRMHLPTAESATVNSRRKAMDPSSCSVCEVVSNNAGSESAARDKKVVYSTASACQLPPPLYSDVQKPDYGLSFPPPAHSHGRAMVKSTGKSVSKMHSSRRSKNPAEGFVRLETAGVTHATQVSAAQPYRQLNVKVRVLDTSPSTTLSAGSSSAPTSSRFLSSTTAVSCQASQPPIVSMPHLSAQYRVPGSQVLALPISAASPLFQPGNTVKQVTLSTSSESTQSRPLVQHDSVYQTEASLTMATNQQSSVLQCSPPPLSSDASNTTTPTLQSGPLTSPSSVAAPTHAVSALCTSPTTSFVTSNPPKLIPSLLTSYSSHSSKSMQAHTTGSIPSVIATPIIPARVSTHKEPLPPLVCGVPTVPETQGRHSILAPLSSPPDSVPPPTVQLLQKQELERRKRVDACTREIVRATVQLITQQVQSRIDQVLQKKLIRSSRLQKPVKLNTAAKESKSSSPTSKSITGHKPCHFSTRETTIDVVPLKEISAVPSQTLLSSATSVDFSQQSQLCTSQQDRLDKKQQSPLKSFQEPVQGSVRSVKDQLQQHLLRQQAGSSQCRGVQVQVISSSCSSGQDTLNTVVQSKIVPPLSTQTREESVQVSPHFNQATQKPTVRYCSQETSSGRHQNYNSSTAGEESQGTDQEIEGKLLTYVVACVASFLVCYVSLLYIVVLTNNISRVSTHFRVSAHAPRKCPP